MIFALVLVACACVPAAGLHAADHGVLMATTDEHTPWSAISALPTQFMQQGSQDGVVQTASAAPASAEARKNTDVRPEDTDVHPEDAEAVVSPIRSSISAPSETTTKGKNKGKGPTRPVKGKGKGPAVPTEEHPATGGGPGKGTSGKGGGSPPPLVGWRERREQEEQRQAEIQKAAAEKAAAFNTQAILRVLLLQFSPSTDCGEQCGERCAEREVARIEGAILSSSPHPDNTLDVVVLPEHFARGYWIDPEENIPDDFQSFTLVAEKIAAIACKYSLHIVLGTTFETCLEEEGKRYCLFMKKGAAQEQMFMACRVLSSSRRPTQISSCNSFFNYVVLDIV